MSFFYIFLSFFTDLILIPDIINVIPNTKTIKAMINNPYVPPPGSSPIIDHKTKGEKTTHKPIIPTPNKIINILNKVFKVNHPHSIKN